MTTFADMHAVVLIWTGNCDAKLQREIAASNTHHKPVYLVRLNRSDYPPGLRRDLVRLVKDVTKGSDYRAVMDEIAGAITADFDNPNRN